MQAKNTPVRIAVKPDQSTLSTAQKSFNALVKKIEKRRLELQEWQGVMDLYHQKVAAELQPRVLKLGELQLVALKALDLAMDTKGLTKPERELLQDVICEMAHDLLQQGGHAEAKAIYNKYSQLDFDAEEKKFADEMKAAMEEAFGIGSGDDLDMTSPEALMDHVREQVAKAHQADMEDVQERRSQRKKTAKQMAREEASKAESEQTSLSIREVYRKLASALHPDREQDPQERVRKTGLMQRVNQAYEKKNLLLLLELQLELEHIDAHAISGLSEQRLKHFNKILKEQLAELDQEIMHFEAPLLAQFQMPGYLRLRSKEVIAMLDAEIAQFDREFRKVERELPLPNDLASLKKWLKARLREAKQNERSMSRMDDDFSFF